jgi:hypothetical protein
MALFSLTGCDNEKVINGKTVPVYGLVNEDAKRDPNIKYEMSPGSVIVAIIFSETIFVPVYVLGWDLFQPVGPK